MKNFLKALFFSGLFALITSHGVMGSSDQREEEPKVNYVHIDLFTTDDASRAFVLGQAVVQNNDGESEIIDLNHENLLRYFNPMPVEKDLVDWRGEAAMDQRFHKLLSEISGEKYEKGLLKSKRFEKKIEEYQGRLKTYLDIHKDFGEFAKRYGFCVEGEDKNLKTKEEKLKYERDFGRVKFFYTLLKGDDIFNRAQDAYDAAEKIKESIFKNAKRSDARRSKENVLSKLRKGINTGDFVKKSDTGKKLYQVNFSRPDRPLKVEKPADFYRASLDPVHKSLSVRFGAAFREFSEKMGIDSEKKLQKKVRESLSFLEKVPALTDLIFKEVDFKEIEGEIYIPHLDELTFQEVKNLTPYHLKNITKANNLFGGKGYGSGSLTLSNLTLDLGEASQKVLEEEIVRLSDAGKLVLNNVSGVGTLDLKKVVRGERSFSPSRVLIANMKDLESLTLEEGLKLRELGLLGNQKLEDLSLFGLKNKGTFTCDTTPNLKDVFLLSEEGEKEKTDFPAHEMTKDSSLKMKTLRAYNAFPQEKKNAIKKLIEFKMKITDENLSLYMEIKQEAKGEVTKRLVDSYLVARKALLRGHFFNKLNPENLTFSGISLYRELLEAERKAEEGGLEEQRAEAKEKKETLRTFFIEYPKDVKDKTREELEGLIRVYPIVKRQYVREKFFFGALEKYLDAKNDKEQTAILYLLPDNLDEELVKAHIKFSELPDFNMSVRILKQYAAGDDEEKAGIFALCAMNLRSAPDNIRILKLLEEKRGGKPSKEEFEAYKKAESTLNIALNPKATYEQVMFYKAYKDVNDQKSAKAYKALLVRDGDALDGKDAAELKALVEAYLVFEEKNVNKQLLGLKRLGIPTLEALKRFADAKNEAEKKAIFFILKGEEALTEGLIQAHVTLAPMRILLTKDLLKAYVSADAEKKTRMLELAKLEITPTPEKVVHYFKLLEFTVPGDVLVKKYVNARKEEIRNNIESLLKIGYTAAEIDSDLLRVFSQFSRRGSEINPTKEHIDYFKIIFDKSSLNNSWLGFLFKDRKDSLLDPYAVLMLISKHQCEFNHNPGDEVARFGEPQETRFDQETRKCKETVEGKFKDMGINAPTDGQKKILADHMIKHVLDGGTIYAKVKREDIPGL